MANRLQGKVAIVTGAGTTGEGMGNGKAVALLFAREGASVVAVDLNQASAQQTADEIQKENGSAIAIGADVSRSEDVRAIVDATLKRFDRIDIVHNNVGIEIAGDPVSTKEEDWDRVHNVNLKSPPAASGGVWMTTDSGASFKQIANSLPTQSIGSLALDATTSPNPTLYVATDEGDNVDDSFYGEGIFATSDFGATWSALPSSNSPFLHMGMPKLAVDTSQSPRHIFAASNYIAFSDNLSANLVLEGDLVKEGLWRSTDGGQSWSQYSAATFGCNYTGGATPCPATDVAIDPRNPSNVYAAFLFTNPFLFRSSDGGDTWHAATLPGIAVTSNKIGRTSIALAPPAAGAPLACSGATRACSTVYVIVGAADFGPAYVGLFKSIDGGATFTAESVPCETLEGVTIDGTADGSSSACAKSSYAQQLYDTILAADPSDSSGQTLVFGGIAPYRSTDSGAHWTFLPSNGGTHTDQHAIAFDPFASGDFFLGNDGGFYRYSQSSTSFTALNTSLSAGQIYSIGPHPTDPTKMVAGLQDNGNQFYRGSLGWNYINGGDGNYSLYDRVDPNFIYLFLGQGVIQRSADGGSTWDDITPTNSLNNAIAAAHDAGGTRALAADPKVAGRVLCGVQFVYVSDDGMKTWQQQTTQTSLTDQCGNPGCSIQQVEFAPSDETRAWALTYNDGNKGFALSNTTQAECPDQPGCPAGVTSAQWNNVTGNLPFNQSRPAPGVATGIAADPNHASVAYLSISGFTATTGVQHIYRTADFGQTWIAADGAGGASPLPDIPVLRTLVDKTDAAGNTLFAATDIGVFMSTDAGASWSAFNLGSLPAVPTFDIEQNQNGAIFIGTHGRGAFALNLPAPPSATPTATPTATATATSTPTATPTPTVVPTPIAATLKVSPKRASFGSVVELGGHGGVSRTINVVLSNPKSRRQDEAIKIKRLDQSGDFIIKPNSCIGMLAPGAKCEVPMVFSPTAPGPRGGFLLVIDNTVTHEHMVSFSGVGKPGKLTISPRSLNLGTVPRGQHGAPKPLTLRNANPIEMTLGEITVSNPDLALGGNCGASLAANSACTIEVTFTPSTAAKESGVLTIGDDAAQSPHHVNVFGKGK